MPGIPVPVHVPLQLNHHLGLLLFSSALGSISDLGENALSKPLEISPATLLRQWLSQILLGAVNIEQSKQLNTSHLGTLLGERPYKVLGKQRQCLGQLATDEIIATVIQEKRSAP